MMYRLEVNEYERARAVFSPLDDHLAVAVMLDGTAPGRIYVDHNQAPTSALARGQRRFYLAGAADNHAFTEGLREVFLGEIYPQAQQEGVKVLQWYYADESWEGALEEILAQKNPVKVGRQYYELKSLRRDWRKAAPAGLDLHTVDAQLLSETNLMNLDALRVEMTSECPSLEEFLKTRLGVCAVIGDEIAGWCLSEYNRGERCEIGIETIEKFQRQGMATLIACALIELAQLQGIRRIGWDCFSENLPSIATALKVGFEKKSEYGVYFMWVEEEKKN